MPYLPAIALAALVVGGVGYLLYQVEARHRRIRGRRAKARQCEIADAGDREFVQVVGKATAVDGPVAGPLFGRPCVYWKLVIEEEAKGKNGSTWVYADSKAAGVSVEVADRSASARVNLQDAAWVGTEFTGRSTSWKAAVEIAQEGGNLDLQRFISETQFKPGSRAARVTEHIIPDGDLIVVWGVAIREPDPEGAARATGYRDAPPTRVVLVAGNEEQPLEATAHVAPHMGWDL